MSVDEAAVTFECVGETLVGILATPPAGKPHARAAVIIIVGGPQYRAGSHRQFTHLARELAAAGWPTLRFDLRGMGDSTGAVAQFEAVSEDIGAAVDAVKLALPQVDSVVLWGLCDGASAALLYLHDRVDSRVGGMCLANPWVRSEVGLARTYVRRYYLQRLLQAAFWRKLVGGGVGRQAVRDFAATVCTFWSSWGAALAAPPAPANFRERMLAGLTRFQGPVLLLLSKQDFTADEFVEHVGQHSGWQAALTRSNMRCVQFEADHTFSDRAAERRMHTACIEWLGECAALPRSGANSIRRAA